MIAVSCPFHWIGERLNTKIADCKKMIWCGFGKKLLLSECNSDQLNISWPFLSSLLGGCPIEWTIEWTYENTKLLKIFLTIFYDMKKIIGYRQPHQVHRSRSLSITTWTKFYPILTPPPSNGNFWT